jgi:hypothetical protein
MIGDSKIIYGNGAINTDIYRGTGAFHCGMKFGIWMLFSLLVRILASKEREGNSMTYEFEADLATIVCYQNLDR